MKKAALFFLALAGSLILNASPLRIEINGQAKRTDFRDVTVQKGLSRQATPWVKDELRSSHLMFIGETGKKWQKFEFSFVPRHTSVVRLLLRGKHTSGKNTQWVDYDKLEISGAELDNSSFEKVDADGVIMDWKLRKVNLFVKQKNAFDGKNFVRVSHDFYVEQDIKVTAGKKVTLSFYARDAKTTPTPHKEAFILREDGKSKPKNEHPKEYYRYYDAKVKYLPLKDKGVLPEQIVKLRWPYPTEFPEAQFAYPSGGKNRPVSLSVPLELLEEDGVARTAEVRCGVPLPEGKFFDLSQLRVTDPAGKAVPAQFAALGYWKDKSVKWVLVQFPAALKAHERSVWHLTNAALAVPEFTGIKVTETADDITVNTGRLSAVISKKQFAMLNDVRVDGRKCGSFLPLTVRDEHGKAWSTAAFVPEKITFEERGAHRVVVKISGSYGDDPAAPGRYIVRIGFTAGSAAADFTITHLNSRLTTEFTDLTSVGLTFVPEHPVYILSMDFAPGSIMQTLSVENGRFFQSDEKTLTIYGSKCSAQLTGAGSVDGRITFCLRDAAQRYPKAFSLSRNAVNFELLPELPDAKFGTQLPYYLQFPLCEGKYRLKWGMSFTERLKIDFSGSLSKKALAAKEIIPVIDRAYLASTGAVPGVMRERNALFDRWDEAAVKAFYGHMKIKAERREYGFLNYGDWFGERGRNWGNNEYDLAHGLFMLFARTGNRDLFRWAQAAARHQADVDIIHAYVDPVCVGANAQHGIGHTGMNHQRIYPGSWSYPIDYSFMGRNGHTWSNGMLDAWCFTGDAAVMDAALKLGEHLRCVTAKTLKQLSSHERSVGWSGKALLAYYGVTGEQKYLDAAKELIAVALKEQKFDKGGAWAHKLPRGHNGGYADAFGNTPFLIGTLLEALREYHRITGDPAVAKSIIAAGKWQQLNWSDAACGFPYTASWDNKPYFQHSYGLNGLVAPGISYRALLTGDKRGGEIAMKIIALDTLIGISSEGKSFALKLVYAGDIFEDIDALRRRYSGIDAGFAPENMINSFAPEKLSFKARGPEKKEFLLVMTGKSAEIELVRTITGSRPNPKPQWTLQLISPDSQVLPSKAQTVKKDYKEKFRLSGKSGDVFRVAISDDMTAFWDVPPAKGVKAFVKLHKESFFSWALPAAYYFTVPAGTESFTVTLGGVHAGTFNGWVIAPDGKTAGRISGQNDMINLPWQKNKSAAQQSVTVKCAKADRAQVWKLLIFASGDIRIMLDGVPPYLSTAPQIWSN